MFNLRINYSALHESESLSLLIRIIISLDKNHYLSW